MNILKELVLEQRDKKRMDKWIRQRFVLTAGELVGSRRVIMEFSEDWAYKDEYIEADRRIEGLARVT